MAIFGRKTPPLQVGDRFAKATDQTRKVWEVTRLWTAINGVPHVRLVGFGPFSVTSRPRRTGRNSRTGETLVIPASKSAKFTAGKCLKDTINDR